MRRRFLRDEGANAAVEFALIVPALFTLILGIISMSALYFSQASVHQAAEWAARYWAVSDAGWTISGTCSFGAPPGSGLSASDLPISCTAGNTVNGTTYFSPADYAKKHYFGAAITDLTFAPTTGTCQAGGGGPSFGGPGVIITATGTYNFNAMFVNIPVGTSTQACYPIIQ